MWFPKWTHKSGERRSGVEFGIALRLPRCGRENRTRTSVLLTAPEEFQIGQLKDILRGKMASQNTKLSPALRALVVKRQRFTMTQGLNKTMWLV